MPGPTFMAHEIRANSGSAIARIIRGGTFAELLGTTGITFVRDTGSASTGRYQRSTLARYKGHVYAAAISQILRLDPATGLWVVWIGFTTTALGQSPSDLIVVDTPSGSFLVTFYGRSNGFNRQDSWVSYDGATTFQATFGGNNDRAEHKLFTHKGLVYAYCAINSTDNRISSYDPVTNTPGQVALVTNDAPSMNGGAGSFFSLDDRLFILYTSSNGVQARIYEFKLGAWVKLTMPGLPTWTGTLGNLASIRVGADALFFQGDSITGALVCLKINVATPGANPVATVLTDPIPDALKAGTGIGTPSQYRCYGFVDTASTPGSAVGYVMFFPDATVSAIPTLFRWIDESTEMAVAASPQITGSSGVPVQFYGGGENVNGLGIPASPLVTTSPEGSVQGTQGVVISFSAWGDAGGGADKTVEGRYFLGAGNTGLGVPITGIATIVPGSVTGGGGATAVGNEIQNVTADGRTFSFEWDFLSDGVPQALVDNLELFITRP